MPPGRNLLLAMTVAILGVALVLAQGHETLEPFSSNNLYGGAMLLIASISFAGVAISARFIGTGTKAIQGTGFGLGVCAIVLMVACMALPKESFEEIYKISRADVAILAYIGVFATGLAYLCFVFGLKLSRSAGIGMAATLIEPVAAALLAAIVLGERLSALQLTGCVVMLFAIVLLLKSEVGIKSSQEVKPA
jgi:DME family drug/metabolite transporter